MEKAPLIQENDIFDIGFRTTSLKKPFQRQLPVYNWFYPFSNEDEVLDIPLKRLTQINWKSINRIAIYIHIPFCDTVCSFCPFTRGLYKEQEEIDAYVNALIREFELKRSFFGKLTVDSIFIGGGTPSVLSVDQISELGRGISKCLDLSNLQEYAVEAEAKSITKEKMLAFKAIGVNRFSYGVQTFSKTHRKALNLDAPINKIKQVAEWANSIFDYTNIDIIYGQAGQSVRDVLDDAKKAIQLSTTSIDFYPMNNLAAQLRMHRSFEDLGYVKPSGAQRMNQRKKIANFMLNKGYKRINGYSYALDNHTNEDLIQKQPNFLYHDILYGFSNDAILGYGASAHSQLPNANLYNTLSRKDYIKYINQHILPFEMRKINPISEKGIVTFPYRGYLYDHELENELPSESTLHLLYDFEKSNLIKKTENFWELTETGWLYYVNMMYLLMPKKGKQWISDRMNQRIQNKHESEDTSL